MILLLLFLELLLKYEEQFNCQIYERWFVEPIETEGTGQEFLIALLGTNLKILGGTTVFWKYWKFTIKSLSRLLEENSILEVLNRADLSLMTSIPVKKLFQNMATQRNQDHDLPIGFLKNQNSSRYTFRSEFLPNYSWSYVARAAGFLHKYFCNEIPTQATLTPSPQAVKTVISSYCISWILIQILQEQVKIQIQIRYS